MPSRKVNGGMHGLNGTFLLSSQQVNVNLVVECPQLTQEAAHRRIAKTVQALSVERIKTVSAAVLNLILSTS